jgi:hypothetical protein
MSPLSNASKQLSPRAILRVLAGGVMGSALLLAGCSNMTMVEYPNYHVAEVESFKTYGAPSRVMMVEVHDRENLVTPETWASALSNHGYPPRLDFITDAGDLAPNQTLRDGYRVVVAVSPSQTTMGEKICTAPETTDYPADTTRIPVRIAFCAGDSPISELRAHFIKDEFEQHLIENGDTIIYQLFPRYIRDDDDHRCGMRRADC